MGAMKDFLMRWLVLTVAAAVMVVLLPGMTAVGQPPILGIAVFALFMALINASIKPVTQLIALPFSILTLAVAVFLLPTLILFVVNAIIFPKYYKLISIGFCAL